MSWHWMPECGDGYVICDANGLAVAFIDSVAGEHVDADRHRDLITSAPNLEEALIELVEAADTALRSMTDPNLEMEACCDKLRTVIKEIKEKGLV